MSALLGSGHPQGKFYDFMQTNQFPCIISKTTTVNANRFALLTATVAHALAKQTNKGWNRSRASVTRTLNITTVKTGRGSDQALLATEFRSLDDVLRNTQVNPAYMKQVDQSLKDRRGSAWLVKITNGTVAAGFRWSLVSQGWWPIISSDARDSYLNESWCNEHYHYLQTCLQFRDNGLRVSV